MEASSNRIAFLDYMRIFAFASVLIGHKLYYDMYLISIDPAAHATIRYLAGVILPLCYGGAGGVIVFFLTSGYIITHVLQKEATIEFLLKRIFRIYPLFIAALLIEAAINVFVKGEPLGSLGIWIPRILLLGDYFGTPYALTSVEWTLRIEVTFYVVIALLKFFGALRHQQYLPIVLAVLSLVISQLPYLPNAPGLAPGYMTIYLPILFVGVCIYCAQYKLCKVNVAIGASLFILLLFFMQTAKIQPNWKEAHFAILATVIFITGLTLNKYLESGPVINILSGLTYSVYLFHNWMWDYIKNFVSVAGPSFIPVTVQTIIVLLAFCYIMQKLVEDPAIKWGRGLYKKIMASRALGNKTALTT